MPRQTTTFELMLRPRDAKTPARQWLYSALRIEILEGRLRPGARLPGTRDLAGQYGLSRGTIVSAFEQLQSEGYVEGSVGSGTYVSKVLPDELLKAPRQIASHATPQSGSKRRVSDYAKRLNLTTTATFDMRPTRAFRTDLPALDLFPTTLWTQIATRRLRRLTATQLLGSEPLGYRPLRTAISDYLIASRGVKCAPEQIAIVSGVQDALDLVARLMLDPGDRVCMEEPGYQGAAEVFETVGARVSAIPLDDQGMKVPHARLRNARLIYITPAHQFPMGMTMSLPRRLELLKWARNSGALIFEDDYDSEYRYSGRPVPSLQGLDASGQVLFFGTFSKVLFPSLRVGYLVIPSDLVPHFTAAIAATRRHAPLLDQVVLCDFITEGHFGRHLRRMRQIYAERLSVLLASARERLAGLLEISDIEAGLQTSGWLSRGITGDAAAKAAAARGVDVVPLNRHSRAAMTREGLQLGFAAVDSREIRRGVRELAIALERRRPAG
jgi:GntR family transcriptional regulator/MocR family aminotransferase